MAYFDEDVRALTATTMPGASTFDVQGQAVRLWVGVLAEDAPETCWVLMKDGALHAATEEDVLTARMVAQKPGAAEATDKNLRS